MLFRSVFIQYLRNFGVEISGYVKNVCGIADESVYTFKEIGKAKQEPLFMLNSEKQEEAMRLLDKLKEEGDTAGGVIEIRVNGLKSGFGSCMQYSTKLDAILCAAAMSVQAIKGVEIGLGFKAANLAGSKVTTKFFIRITVFAAKPTMPAELRAECQTVKK